jgi:hypothetical protein
VADHTGHPAGQHNGHRLGRHRGAPGLGVRDQQAVFFHRDEATLPFAHRFEPDICLDGRASEYPALVPFSAGHAGCPGRNLVLFTTSTLLASFLSGHRFRLLSGPRLDPERPPPCTINNFGLNFAVACVQVT